MRALVVYESMFGNTRDIAEAIARGLRVSLDVSVMEVGHADPHLDDADLLVVGGPTHAWGMSRDSTRRGLSDAIGIREWLHLLQPPVGDVDAAAFDTAMTTRWFPVGSAARGEARELKAHGFHLVADPAQFRVRGREGPLVVGELERAFHWGERIGSELLARSRPPNAAAAVVS